MNRIASERALLGINQYELADRLDASKTTVSNWEKGGSINQAALIKMREVFGCDIDWLLGLSNERKTIKD